MTDYYNGNNKTNSPIQKAFGKSNFSSLTNGDLRQEMHQIILDFLEECQWDKEIIEREIVRL